jgi:DNA primase
MAGFIPDGTLEQIRAASDIVEVINSYVPLKRAGGGFVALCPFHKEKTPSFHVTPHKQTFHCFGCHKGGDVFTFVREYENLSFMEAVRRLAERANIVLEYARDPAQSEAVQLKEKLLQIHEQLAQRWQNALANEAAGQIARDYLAKRAVPPEAIRLFRLGYSPDSWEDTVNWGLSRDYPAELLEKAGLVIRHEESKRFYGRFRGRLMFPICDEQGRVIGFSGRVLAGDEKTAKYINSPETPLFVKGKVIFGLDKSKRSLLDCGTAIICEGQLDLIACYNSGIQNVVAPQGTALTADHARILKRYVEEVILCFDSDSAGQNATVRALDDLLASGLSFRVATLPAPHDPDSLIKSQGVAALQTCLDRAEGFFDFLLRRLCQQNDTATDRGRLAVLHGMADAILKTGNQVLVDTYAQKTAQRLGVSTDSVRTEFRKRNRPSQPVREEQPETPLARPLGPRPSMLEFWLLKLVLLDDTLVEWTQHHLDMAWVQHFSVRKILEQRIEAEHQQTWTSLARFLAQFEDPEDQSLISEAVSEKREIPNRAQQLQDVVKRLRDQFLDRQLVLLSQRIADPQLSDSDRQSLVQQQCHLRMLKQTELSPVADQM